MSKLVNVLTRTSGRPAFFKDHVESVNSQSYPYVRHLVCADDQQSLEYASELVDDVIYIPGQPRRDEYGIMHAPYNLYINRLMEEVDGGWVMFLDDDDSFTGPDSLERIMRHVEDPDVLAVWKVQFPNEVIPGSAFGKSIRLGQISGIGFMFHSHHIWAAQWDEVKESDFRVALKLARTLGSIMWIDGIMTRVNNTRGTENGPGGGFGSRNDKYDSTS